ncbi:MAG: hypothetical protein ACXVCI_00075 [Bdellovibrionota bacterium]
MAWMAQRLLLRFFWGIFLLSGALPEMAAANPLPLPQREIPAKLLLKQPEAALLQRELYRAFGILALDQTDEHAPIVLRSLLFLLQHGPKALHTIEGLRFLYAYFGHDASVDIAAYHPQAKAVSIGGRSAYGESRDAFSLPVLAALAHEIGHAFLLENITPGELQEISTRWGNWGKVFAGKKPSSLYDPAFLKEPLPQPGGELPSQYAATNVHEWFADSFAAVLLCKLGREQQLGINWQERLHQRPKHSGEFWTRYDQVPAGFTAWIENRLRRSSDKVWSGR